MHSLVTASRPRLSETAPVRKWCVFEMSCMRSADESASQK